MPTDEGTVDAVLAAAMDSVGVLATLVDPDAVTGLVAILRAEHPDADAERLAGMIDWPTVRYTDEPVLHYSERVFWLRKARGE